MTDRKKPRGASGALAGLLISPRTWSYFVCGGCMRDLFFTHEGETCPHCECSELWYVEGEMPDSNGNTIDFRSRSPLTPSPGNEGRANRPNGRHGGRRRSGKRGRGSQTARVRCAGASPVPAG